METPNLAFQVGPLSDGVGDGASDGATSPATESPVAQLERRRASGLTIRELLAALVPGSLYLVLAASMAIFADWNRPLSWSALVAVVLCYAVASNVEFPVSVGWTDPSQVAFVPMLFVLPTALVPIVAGIALFLGSLPAVLRGRRHPERLVFDVANSWYTLAPAAVLVASAATGPTLHEWWIYLIALGAQFGFDLLGTAVLHWLTVGKRTRIASSVGWCYLVDGLLSSVGLLVAFACAAGGPAAILLVLPLFAVIELFARDRRARIEGAVELQNAYRGTAMLLGDFIEADHAYTGSHSRSVVELSVAVADALNLSPAQRRNVEFGALLHDIGKIAVPESIIDKPGPLNDAEWEIIKCHTIDGQRMLERVGGVLGAVGIVVRASHEHYDGRGYPDGLSGEDIPIEARIVSCCDAFSAMTTDRSYRSAMTHDAALLELELHSGTQFDPHVAAALIEIVRHQPRPLGSREAQRAHVKV